MKVEVVKPGSLFDNRSLAPAKEGEACMIARRSPESVVGIRELGSPHIVVV